MTSILPHTIALLISLLCSATPAVAQPATLADAAGRDPISCALYLARVHVDTADRIAHMSRVADAMTKVGRKEEALGLLSEASLLLGASEGPNNRAAGRVEMAERFEAAGNSDEARRLLGEVVSLFIVENSTRHAGSMTVAASDNWGELLPRIATAYAHLGDFEASSNVRSMWESYWTNSIDSSKSSVLLQFEHGQYQQRRVEMLAQLARASTVHGDLLGARDAMALAFAIARNIDDPNYRWPALLTLLHTVDSVGVRNSANRLLSEVDEAMQSAQHVPSFSWLRLVEEHLDGGNLGRARQLIWIEASSPVQLDGEQLARLYARLGQVDSALIFAEGEKLNTMKAGGLTNIADELLRRGQPDSAITYYRRALEVARNANPMRTSTRAYVRPGIALYRLGATDEGIAALELALAAAATQPDPSRTIYALLGVGEAYAAIGQVPSERARKTLEALKGKADFVGQ